MTTQRFDQPQITRRAMAGGMLSAGLLAKEPFLAWAQDSNPYKESEQNSSHAPVSSRDVIKITQMETFLVKPRWLFRNANPNVIMRTTLVERPFNIVGLKNIL